MSNWWESNGNSWDAAGDDKWKDSGASWEKETPSWEQAGDPWSKDNAQAAETEQQADAQWNEGGDNSWNQQQSWDDSAATAAETTMPPAVEEASTGGWNQDSKDNKWGGDWGNAAGAASNGQQPNAKHYWETQAWNKESNVCPKKADWELEQEDASFFTERLGSNAIISQYQHVPVDVTGNKASIIPALDTFEAMYEEFAELVPEALKENVRRCQYSVPTPVQKYAIPVGLCGRDTMCCAQTGSGKTAAFLFPVIGRMLKHHDNPVGAMETPFEGKCTPDTLILTPTRELCIQIHEEAQKFCHRTKYRTCRVYGGEPPKVQMEQLAKGCDLMVACPGRLEDFIGREIIDVSKVFILVLDEADRMLDMGFEKSIRNIVQEYGMPGQDGRQTMMFSATFPEECQKMAQDFLYDYIWIGVGIVGGACEQVSQRLEKLKPAEKYEKLIELLDHFYTNRGEQKDRCLVFVNAKDTAKWLDEQLYEKHIDTGALHGNLTQEQRETNLRRFRSGEIDVMVATDVAARGLDIEKVALVINYDFPQDIDTYVHRIGRTGRIGNKGEAHTFVAVDEYGTVIEKGETLRRLDSIMRDAHSAVPDWLEGAMEAGGDSWGAAASGKDSGDTWKNWGGKDMRSQW
mmetsp:Transcript_26417/g.49818  ORF Transcript_26417/g.49818 Transcript_26417/m.49818 type:complete len:631 (+) Transcript_26417:49-1941(+)